MAISNLDLNDDLFTYYPEIIIILLSAKGVNIPGHSPKFIRF